MKVRSMNKEGVVTAIKNFILPELKEIKDRKDSPRDGAN